MPTSAAAQTKRYYRTSNNYDRNPLDEQGNIVGLDTARNRSPSRSHRMLFPRKSTTAVKNNKHSKMMSGISLWKVVIRTLLLIALYYMSSIGLTFYQKWLLKRFHYPLSIVITHLVVKFILSASCRIVWESWSRSKRPVLMWSPYASQLAPAGIASALDIGLSNWSFEFITVSLYTMSKSTAIIFITGFALFFKLEKKHWTLMLVVIMISGGLVMFTYQATQFNLAGFLMVISASFLSGLRWTLSQMLMQRADMGLANPIDMMYHMQPWMIITLLPFAIAFEGLNLATTENVFRFGEIYILIKMIGRVLIGAVIAFFMELAEYLLVSYTSSLTLAISGIVKEVITLTLAIVINHDELSLLNGVGLVICLAGITLHVGIKAWRMRIEAVEPTSKNYCHSGEEVLLMSNLNSDSEEVDHVIFESRR